MIPSSREEQGFTLIELLVVMIIISILMAVAVPTFLSQKNTALKTQATADIKNVINAVESCASQITTGGYIDYSSDPATSCADMTTLTGYEASLTNLNIQADAPKAGPEGVNQTQVLLTGDTKQGYIVQREIQDSGKNVFFAEIHTEAGALYRWCDVDTAVDPTQKDPIVTPGKNDATKTCKNGKW